MKKIAIGNDFRVSWTLKQLGQAFELFGKTFDIVVKSPYAVIRVDDIQAVGNVVSFNVPASEQIYIGSYDIDINIEDNANGKRWTLRQCNAFALAPCCECGDVVEVVQLESNIVYPANGLSAYEIAVLNGYTGTYEEWVKWYAKPNAMRVTFSPYGSDEAYDMGQVSGELFDKFFDEVPENPIIIPEPEPEPEPTPTYPYYAYTDMGFGKNFRGVGEWDEITEEVSNG